MPDLPLHPPLLRDTPFTVPVTQRTTEFVGNVWDIVTETFTYNGVATTRSFMEHSGAVAVLAMDEDGSILVIEQYRHPIRERDWEIPAGLLDEEGEPKLDAAKRELAEEVDLVADRWDVLAEVATTPGGSNEAIVIYLARGLSPTPTPFEREAEEADIVIRWVSLDEVVSAVLAGTVRNAGLVVAVLAAFASRAEGWASLRRAD